MSKRIPVIVTRFGDLDVDDPFLPAPVAGLTNLDARGYRVECGDVKAHVWKDGDRWTVTGCWIGDDRYLGFPYPLDTYGSAMQWARQWVRRELPAIPYIATVARLDRFV